MRQPYHPDTASITLTGVLYALSDPARLEIVRSLENGKEKPCGDFGLHTKSTMSHHFKVLREAGITRTRTEGRRRFTSLRQEDLDARFPGLLQAVLGARKPL
jgi:DNA-binding transcriptional ArsR family regulator